MKYKINDEGLEEGKFPSSTGKQVLIENKASILKTIDDNIIDNSIKYISNADILIVAGTSLTVYPAAGLIRYYRGNKLVLINKDKTPYDKLANLVINESLGEVFKEI